MTQATNYVTQVRCTLCSQLYDLDAVQYTCPSCGAVGTLDVRYDYDALRRAITPEEISAKRDFTMWRYRPILPIVDDEFIPPLPVGWTPLIPALRLADQLGINRLWLKDEGRNPTASLKDRASAMVVARGAQLGVDVITTASTGNAAAALAGLCASMGKRAVIFVPARAPEAKITQLLVYGATVFLVDGTYDDAFDLCVQAAEEYGWYNRNTGMNPYTTEGKKTAAFEVVEQLGWRAPDVMIVGVGDGSILGGQHKGFYDLYTLGWIDRIPRLIGVQAEGSSGMVRAWVEGRDPMMIEREPADTIADSISSSLPRDRVKAMRAVRDTGGAFVSVSDEAIIDAIPELARQTGVFAEPAAAATLAGLRQAQLQGLISPRDEIVLLITGNGLKDIASAKRSVGKAYPVEASMASVEKLVKRLEVV